MTLAQSLQERAARAVPAAYQENAGGWWLRHADGSAWWTGSVLPHAAGDLTGRVAGAEAFYARHGAPARFQITPGACPAALDSVLAARGYREGTPVSLRTAALTGLPYGAAARVDEQPTDEWFATWCAVNGGSAADREVLRRVRLPGAYVTVRAGPDVIAVGRAVAEDGWAGIFGMATVPSARGRGAGTRVLAALAGWARRHGAEHMYLQVEFDNTAALRLYERAGFVEVCRYHYRTAPTGTRTEPADGSSRSSPASVWVKPQASR